MKKLIGLLTLLSVISFSQENPVAGKNFIISYNPSESKIFTSPEFLTAVYSFGNWSLEGLVYEEDSVLNHKVIKTDSGKVHQSIEMKKEGETWTAILKTPSDAKILYYYITDGKVSDFNNEKIFYKYIYNEAGKPVRDAHFSRFDLLKKTEAPIEEQLKEAEAEIEFYLDYFIAQGAYWRLKFETDTTMEMLMQTKEHFENSFKELEKQFPFNDTLLTVKGIVYTRYQTAVLKLISTKYMAEHSYAKERYMEIFERIPEERRFPDYLNEKYKNDVQIKKDSEDAKKFRSDIVGKEAPDFDFVSIKGQTGKLSDYKGKLVLLDFWGTWCVPCVAEIPNLREAYENYKDKGFEIISISSDGFMKKKDEKSLQDFATKNEMIWNQILDNELKYIHNLYKINRWPTLYLVDQNGIIIEAEENLRGKGLQQTLSNYLK